MAQTAEGEDARHLQGRDLAFSFGEFGLQALSCGFVTSRQIEAARIAISRHVKRGGKLYIRIFPDKPISKKPARRAWVTRIRNAILARHGGR